MSEVDMGPRSPSLLPTNEGDGDEPMSPCSCASCLSAWAFDPTHLRPEIWSLILSYLPLPALASLRLTCYALSTLTTPPLFRTFRWSSPLSPSGQNSGYKDAEARSAVSALWGNCRRAIVWQTRGQKWNDATAPLPSYLCTFLPLLSNIRELQLRRVNLDARLVLILEGIKALTSLDLQMCSFGLHTSELSTHEGTLRLESLTIHEPRGILWDHWASCLSLISSSTLRALSLQGDEYHFASFISRALPQLTALNLHTLDLRLISSHLAKFSTFLASQPHLRRLKLKVDFLWQAGTNDLHLPADSLKELEELYTPCDPSLWSAFLPNRPIRVFGRSDPVIAEKAANEMLREALLAVSRAEARPLTLDLPWVDGVDEGFVRDVLPLLPAYTERITLRVIDELSPEVLIRLRGLVGALPRLREVRILAYRVAASGGGSVGSDVLRAQGELVLAWAEGCEELRGVELGGVNWVRVGRGEWVAYEAEEGGSDVPRARVRVLGALAEGPNEKPTGEIRTSCGLQFWAKGVEYGAFDKGGVSYVQEVEDLNVAVA